MANVTCASGNLAINPKAGLLFIDYASGDTLQMTVRFANFM